MYDALVRPPTISISLSALASGSAKRRPVRYCDDTSPGRVKRPPLKVPLQVTGSSMPGVCRSNAMPCSSSAAHKLLMGRIGNLPWPTNVASAPRTAATDTRKRSVEPLSPQSSVAPLCKETGTTLNTPLLYSILAPRAFNECMVAIISSFTLLHATVTGSAPSAAQMSKR